MPVEPCPCGSILIWSHSWLFSGVDWSWSKNCPSMLLFLRYCKLSISTRRHIPIQNCLNRGICFCASVVVKMWGKRNHQRGSVVAQNEHVQAVVTLRICLRRSRSNIFHMLSCFHPRVSWPCRVFFCLLTIIKLSLKIIVQCPVLRPYKIFIATVCPSQEFCKPTSVSEKTSDGFCFTIPSFLLTYLIMLPKQWSSGVDCIYAYMYVCNVCI